RIVAAAVAAVGIVAAVPAVGLLSGGADPEDAARIADLPARATAPARVSTAGPYAMSVAVTVAALAAAVVLWRTPRSQAGLSSKYDSPAARRDAAARRGEGDERVTERALWDALDAGEDPTLDADPAPDASGNPPGDTEGDDDSGTRR
ncbi:Trp biosynthesis-associated membrane protein, partial [Rhodococcus zopfii]|uniref:Trp biosynthesis-associated membrane protein n=1 Tax=Rhodococcus zopfii TaxID=43772 RepID=UPI001EDF3F36